MAINQLSARKVETAPAKPEPYSLADGGSLFLLIQPNGSKLWRYRYRIGGRNQIFSVGKYPDVSLEAARGERDRARDLVKKGIHPLLDRKAKVAAQIERNDNSFKSVAKRWMADKTWSDGYRKQVEGYLESDVFPKIGSLPLSEVKAAHLRPIILAVGKRGAEHPANLIRQWCSQIFSWAGAHGIVDHDPTSLLKGLVQRPRVRHNPSLNWAELHGLLTKLSGWPGYRTTIIAIRLLSLTFVRTVEIRKATWSEFDLAGKTWTIPAARMKMRRVHLVPLSDSAVEALTELKTLTGGIGVLFPNYRKPNEVMSSTTVNRALERLGYGGRFSGHGFRSTATTLLGLLGYPKARIDLQLAHDKKDSSRAPYDHTKYIASRRLIMRDWADILAAVERGDSVDEITERFGPLSARRTELMRVIEREE